MTDSRNLTPEDYCCVLVGQFLQAWSAMELALHDAIGAALTIQPVQIRILCCNINYRDKVDILRTLVDVSHFAPDVRESAKRKLRKLGNHARKRNMVAHTPFMPDEKSGGVVFLTVRAKGEYEASRTVWSVHAFTEENRALHRYTLFLECLQQRFEQKPLTQQSYFNALRPFLDYSGFGSNMDWGGLARSMSTQGTSGQAPSHPQSLPDQVHPDSDPTTSEKSAQTPETPQEKE